MLDPTVATDLECLARWNGEIADLVHPYLEDPEALFWYDVEEASGEVWIRAQGGVRSQRALAAADAVLGLNREDLRKLRYNEFATIATLKLVLEEEALSANSRNLILREFARRQKDSFPFAGMHRFFARTWAIPAL